MENFGILKNIIEHALQSSQGKASWCLAWYSEKWSKKVSVRELFPKALPVHRETRASHKAGLGLDYLGDLLKSLECQITREGESLARLYSESSQDRWKNAVHT